jgi:hypothetical protein
MTNKVIAGASLAILFVSLAAPALAADANRAGDSNKPLREMRLDTFLAKYNGYVDDYKEANKPAKQAEIVAKMKKAIQADLPGVVVTLSGQVADAKVNKDGSVSVTLASVDELERLRGKPAGGVFRIGSSDWAKGGRLDLKITPAQAAGVKKGDKFLLRARATVQSEDESYANSGFLIPVSMSMTIRIERNFVEKNVPVCELALSKYTVTLAGADYGPAEAK